MGLLISGQGPLWHGRVNPVREPLERWPEGEPGAEG